MRIERDYLDRYDPDDVESIVAYSKLLEGRRVREVISEKDIQVCEASNDKGLFGKIIEFGFFLIERNNLPEPDLGHGIELKTTPLRRRKDGTMYPKERMSISLINYEGVYDGMTFEESVHWKLDKLLVVFYLYDRYAGIRDRYIDRVVLWRTPHEDMLIIRRDWEIIQDLIRKGQAHRLSGRLTIYLEPAPKGRNKKDLVTYGDGYEAMRRGFAFKACYVNVIYQSGERKRPESGASIPGDWSRPFDDVVLDRFRPYEGLDTEEIASRLGVELGTAKDRYATLARYMVCGRNVRRIEELDKAGILMKTVRVRPNGRPAEPMTFPAFDYHEVAESEWEDSEFRDTLDRKVLLVVFDLGEDGSVVFRRAVLWLVPEDDVRTISHTWMDTHDRINDGSYRFITHQRDAEIAFVKPHNTKGGRRPVCPDGMEREKMCFALKQDYIEGIVRGFGP